MAQRLLLDKDINLLIRSNVTKEYPELIDFIKSTPETTRHTASASFLQFYDNLYGHVRTAAVAEWKLDPKNPPEEVDPIKEKRNCELCNKEKIKYIFHIVNDKTDEKLQVGSSCIRHFDMVFRSRADELLKDLKKLGRRTELDRSIPGIMNRLLNWDNTIRSAPIIIGKKLEDSYYVLGRRLKELTTAYIDKVELSGAVRQDLLKKIENLISEADTLVQQIAIYIDENKEDRYIPPRQSRDYLARINDIDGLDFLDQDRRITPRVFHRLAIPQIMEEFRPEIDTALKTTGFRVMRLYSSGYIINATFRPNINLALDHKIFTRSFARYIMFAHQEDRKPTVQDILNSSSISGENSYRLTFDYILGKVDNRYVTFIVTDLEKVDYEFINYELNEVAFSIPFDAKTQHAIDDGIIYPIPDVDQYILVNFMEFVEKFKSLAFIQNSFTTETITNYILNPDNKRIGKSDYHELRKSRSRSNA